MAGSPTNPGSGPPGGAPLGSLAWAAETGGNLSTGQGLRLVGRACLQVAPRAAVYRSLAAVWRRRRSRGSVEFDWHQTPPGELAELAERACRDVLSEPMVNHSFRTWAFGRILAEIDDVRLDDDLFFAAALLHDLGLGRPSYQRCFTLTGADKLTEIGTTCGVDTDRTKAAAAGITHHITPALTLAEGGPIGYYLQAGSLLDLIGWRVTSIPRDDAYDISVVSWPSNGIRREVGARWRAESAMVPGGRASLLQRWTRFSFLPRFSPLPPSRSGSLS